MVESNPQCDNQIRIRILGTPEVWVGDRRQDPLSGLGIWLLGSLALHSGQLVSERRLVELVWGFQRASTSALRSAVSRLRSTLRELCAGSVAIEHLNHGYRLSCLDRVRIDAADFRQLVGQADAASPSDRLILLSSALKLWRGPVLDGAPDPLIHTVEANSLRRDRLRTAAALVAAAAEAGQVAAAVDPLWRVAADDPFDVPTQALLLTTLGAAGLGGRLAEAYSLTERRFRDELNVQVPRQLVEAYHAAAAAMTGVEGERPESVGPGFDLLTADLLTADLLTADLLTAELRTGDLLGSEPLGSGAGAVRGVVPACRPPSASPGSYHHIPAYTQLRDYLDGPPVAAGFVLTGPRSVLKTALAAHAADAIGASSAYRVLWASLDESTSTDEVLVRFLRALGVPPAEIPRSASLHADMLRDCLDQVPSVLFLDGVSRRGQALPFVPGTTRSKLVVLGDLPAFALPGFAYSHPVWLRRRRQFQRRQVSC